MADRQPYEIARETVKQLTARKLAPTPDNYLTIYHEIAGTKRLQPFPEAQLQAIANALPTATPGQQRLQAQADHAVRHHNWTALQQALVSYTQLGPGPRQFGDAASTAPAPLSMARLDGQRPALTAEVREQLIRLVGNAVAAVTVDDPQLADKSAALLAELTQDAPDQAILRAQLANFNFRLSFKAEEQGAVRSTLLELLYLVFQNIGELSLDERWLKGQMDALMTASTPPLTLRRLEDVRIRLKDVIYKQTEAKAQTMAAQAEMKRMLGAFIERLSSMTASSSSFRGKIEQYAEQIASATSIADIAPVMAQAVAAARSMSLDSQRASDELQGMRDKAAQTEERIAQLQAELDRASAQARNDPLTGLLNRKGLDETVEREITISRRKQSSLCVSLLDIDNFKKINDTHGHETGDAALVHLTQVARECIRPQDTLGRYGGEEFVVVMPETSIEQGIEVMTRVQRELTRRFFLAGTQKLLITFSAGVAQLGDEESGANAVDRADQAMYLAKRSGKNRVVAA
jgi:diguanylate cyclase